MLIQSGTTWEKCLVITTWYSVLASYGARFDVICQIRVFNLKMCCCLTGELGHYLLWFPSGKMSAENTWRRAWPCMKLIELGRVWHAASLGTLKHLLQVEPVYFAPEMWVILCNVKESSFGEMSSVTWSMVLCLLHKWSLDTHSHSSMLCVADHFVPSHLQTAVPGWEMGRIWERR